MADFQLTVCGSLVLRAFPLMGDKGCWALLELAALFGRDFDEVAGLHSTMTYIPCYPASKSGRESSSESAVGGPLPSSERGMKLEKDGLRG